MNIHTLILQLRIYQKIAFFIHPIVTFKWYLKKLFPQNFNKKLFSANAVLFRPQKPRKKCLHMPYFNTFFSHLKQIRYSLNVDNGTCKIFN